MTRKIIIYYIDAQLNSYSNFFFPFGIGLGHSLTESFLKALKTKAWFCLEHAL